jgi:dolichol-phosphate mannosyltransferase
MSSVYQERFVSHPRISDQAASVPEPCPKLSIVVAAFCEKDNLQKLYEELVASLMPLDITWELILVDDGSTEEDTWNEISSLHDQDARVKGVRFSRNFGHQYGLFAGLSSARGQAVITMDADLQHPPSAIPLLLREWNSGRKIVHTVRIDNVQTSWFKRTTSLAFYKLFSFLSGVDLSAGMSDFRLLDRRVVDELLQFREMGLFLRGLVHWVGYSSSKVPFQCQSRFAGTSKYNFRRMIRFAWTGITSFSTIPLRAGIIIGLLTSLVAFYQLGEALWLKFFTDRAVPGWASIIGLQSLLFGVLFILLGVLGEYMARILEEVRGRPRFIISETLGLSVEKSQPSPAPASPQYSQLRGHE